MSNFKELALKYKKKQNVTLADSIVAGMSLVDNVSVDLGLISDSGLLDAASFGLPLLLIAFTESSRVLTGRKTATAGMQDSVFRMAKTGIAMSTGAFVAGLGAGALPAVPVAMGLRAVMDKYRSSSMTGQRVQRRIQRLRALREQPLRETSGLEALPDERALLY